MTWEEDKALLRRFAVALVRWHKAQVGQKKLILPERPESWESKRDKIRLAVAVMVFIEAWKRGQLRLLFNLIITGMEMKLTWDEIKDRATGVFYERQIKEAVDRYRAEHPAYFEANVDGVPGYDHWKAEQKNK